MFVHNLTDPQLLQGKKERKLFTLSFFSNKFQQFTVHTQKENLNRVGGVYVIVVIPVFGKSCCVERSYL